MLAALKVSVPVPDLVSAPAPASTAVNDRSSVPETISPAVKAIGLPIDREPPTARSVPDDPVIIPVPLIVEPSSTVPPDPIPTSAPAPIVIVPSTDTRPATSMSVPVPAATVSVTPLETVSWPPVSTTTWSIDLLVPTVTTWPDRIVITVSVIVGAWIAATQLVPLNRSQVEAESHAPVAALR